MRLPETLLSTEFTEWHTYALEWHPSKATFWVDNTEVLRVPNPPTRPLGFVAWRDNQYAIATPQGVLRFGTVACDAQWVEMDSVSIVPLRNSVRILIPTQYYVNHTIILGFKSTHI